jgi:hypothetical protein
MNTWSLTGLKICRIGFWVHVFSLGGLFTGHTAPIYFAPI